MNNEPGETDEGRNPENIPLQKLNEQEEEEQFNNEDEQQETDFGGGEQQQTQEQPDLGGTSEENRQSEEVGDARNEENEEFKRKEFKKYLNVPIKREWKQEFFDSVKFIPRKSGKSTGKISYKGEEVFYIEKGEMKTYKGKEELSEEFHREIRELKANICNANFSNSQTVNIGLTPWEIERFDSYFKKAELEYKNFPRRLEILQELEEEIGRLDAVDNERLVKKAKQVSDKIRTELLGELPKYEDPEEVEMVRRDRFIEQLILLVKPLLNSLQNLDLLSHQSEVL